MLSGRIAIGVRVDPRLRISTPALAAALLERHPSLSAHSCVNGEGGTLGAVIDHTSVPHLFEHLVIDLQVHAAGSPDDPFVGTTEWTCERLGRALVQVSFSDDLVALRACSEAACELDGLLSSAV